MSFGYPSKRSGLFTYSEPHRFNAMAARPDTSNEQSIGAPRASVDTRFEDGDENNNEKPQGLIPAKSNSSGTDRGQAQSDMLVGIVLAIGLAIIVGFFVLFMANETIVMTNMTEEDPLYQAQEELVTTTNDTFGMYGLLFMAVIFSIALIFLWRIRGQA